mgnify:CR=1 FL=1
MQLKHAAQVSLPGVGTHCSKLSARLNSKRGLRLPLLSSLSSVSPVSGLRVRPLVLNSPVVNPLNRRWPVRELTVASTICAKRSITTGTKMKTSMSASTFVP